MHGGKIGFEREQDQVLRAREKNSAAVPGIACLPRTEHVQAFRVHDYYAALAHLDSTGCL